ncbi:MAG: hypothetical protein IKB70_04705 [Bacilli bacterium]|nr:hypothetical protein [Bacilli bacterium]
MELLTTQQLKNHIVGEGITVAAIMTVVLAAILAVVIYRLFLSNKGGVTIPGGWKFSWS